MGNPVPTQTRTIDPYASYNSDVANRQIHSITSGDDCILVVDPINVTIDSTSSEQVVCSAGMVVKDDVLIEISSLTIDMTDSDYYEGGTIWSTSGYYYVVLKYDYVKSSPAPTASIYVLLPTERAAYIADPSSYVFLACLSVSTGPLSVDEVLTNDPDNPDDAKRSLRGSSSGLISIVNYNTSTEITGYENTIITSGTITLTIPKSANSEKAVRIIKGDSNATTLTLIPSSGDSFGDSTAIVIVEQYDKTYLVPDGSVTWVEKDYRFTDIESRISSLESATSNSYTGTIDSTSDWAIVIDPTFGSVYRATVNHSLSNKYVSCTCYENDEMFMPLKIVANDANSLYVYMPTNTLTVEVHCV